MTNKEKLQQEARAYLLKYVQPTDTLGVIIKSVSKSGMTRRMRVIDKDMTDISYYVANAIEWSYNDKGILVSGCGMDMTFHLIDTLTWSMYGKDKPSTLKGNGGGCLAWRTF